MSEAILVALITGGLSLAGVAITNHTAGRNIRAAIETKQAVTETKIDELTREVRMHNGFAERIPVVEGDIRLLQEKVKVANHRIDDLEKIKDA